MTRSEAVPPERDQPFEVPYREVEHEAPYDPAEDWTSFPGQFPIGTAKLDLYGWAPTKTQRDKWRKEVEAVERRRIPLGFRAIG